MQVWCAFNFALQCNVLKKCLGWRPNASGVSSPLPIVTGSSTSQWIQRSSCIASSHADPASNNGKAQRYITHLAEILRRKTRTIRLKMVKVWALRVLLCPSEDLPISKTTRTIVGVEAIPAPKWDKGGSSSTTTATKTTTIAAKTKTTTPPPPPRWVEGVHLRTPLWWKQRRWLFWAA